MAFLVDDISINTIIGHGSSVVGDLYVAGCARIDGDLDGSLESDGRVMIGATARVHANIRAHSVIVGGVVQGDIIAPESVTLFSTAIIFGDIITKKLRVETEVILHGRCIALKASQEFEAAKNQWLDKVAVQKIHKRNK